MDSFGARSILTVGSRQYEIFRLDALAKEGVDVTRLPFSLRILLENLLRTEDGHSVTADDGSFDSGLIDSGRTFERVFDRAGSYAYHCTPHPFMTARVIVEP